MSGQNTELYAGIVVALVIGAAVGYFVYPAMNNEPAPAPEPQPQVRDHNHLGLWLVVLATIALGTVTTKSFLQHLTRG